MVIGITANVEKTEALYLVKEFLTKLDGKDTSFVVEDEVAARLDLSEQDLSLSPLPQFSDACDIVISFGGDGTILSTARGLGRPTVPILGVKMGGMGFLAELTPEELYAHADALIEGRYEIIERMVLQAELEGDESKTRYFALNDFVFDKGGISRVISIKTFIDDEFLNTYIADGLIISTATGSTAYSLAAGGPILMPSMEAIIINPISPHTLGARPVVISGDRVVTIKIEFAPREVLLSADGQVGEKLKRGAVTTIRKADHCVKLVSIQRRSFYDVLRAKLNWGEDIRDNQESPPAD